MANDPRSAVHRLALGDVAAVEQVIAAASTSDDVAVLIAAAQVAAEPEALIARAGQVATTSRDRQLVAIATAHRLGDRDLVDALVRDHLVDHPDSVVAAWIAARNQADPTSVNPSVHQEES
jgi:hypothetical protein